MTKMYEVHLQVPVRLLTPLLELIEGEGIVVKLGEPKQQSGKHVRYVGGHRKKAMSGEDCVLAALNARTSKLCTRAQLKEALGECQFAPSSLSPYLSKLTKKNLIKVDGDTVTLTPSSSRGNGQLNQKE